MNILKNTIKGVVLGLFVLTVFGIGVNNTFAATLNTDSSDAATLRVKNTNGQVNNLSWSTSANADSGDTVSFAIWYHNTSSETANNLRVRLSPQNTGTGTSHSFTAYVWADNAQQVSGSVTVNLTSSQSLSFSSGSVIWRPNQTISGSQPFPNGQNGSEIFSSNGISVGDISPGWSAQGSVVLNFNVSNSGHTQLPSATTYPASGVTDRFAVLEGHVNPYSTSDTTRWFEWGTTSWSLNNKTTVRNQGGSAGTFSDTATGLSPNTTYYYRAVAQNSAGRVDGGIQSFTTINNNNNQRPFVSTSNATNITQSSARLNGYVNPYNTYGTSRWFEWGTTQGLGSRTNTLNHGNTASNFSETIAGLSNNTTYYYRAVAQNSYGTNYGNIVSFKTGMGVVNNTPPTAITNLATNIDENSARLNALAIINGNVASTGWYEWGPSENLGFTTAVQNIGSLSSVSFKQSMYGLTPNTTYYYRAVVQNVNGISRGSILNFRTNSKYIPPNPGPSKTRRVSIVKELENLTSPNGTRESVEALRGDIVRFTIAVENTGDYTLEDVEVKDLIPYYLEFANAEEKNVDALQREVVWFVGDMRSGYREEMTLDVIVTGDARIGSRIENVARVESLRLTRTSNEVEIEVTSQINTLTAAVFFGGAFLPDTLIEWLLLIILILIVVIASRKVYGDYEDRREARKEV